MANYQFIDLSPTTGKNFYRLIQEDYDGTQAISDMRMLNFSERNAGVVFYPNPAKNQININASSHSEEFDYTLTNATGLTIVSGTGSGQTSIDCSTVVNGIYYLVIHSKDQRTVERITITK